MTDQMRGLDALLEMLKTRRPAWTKSEQKWINRWLMPLGCTEDGFGNLWLRIGNAPVLWSSHTDTVHREGGKQRLAMTEDGKIFLHPDEMISNCLGADDTSGVWLMREMILDQVPGLYIFHRDEEAGGRGSGWIAENLAHELTGIKFAIALDRKGFGDVITHQWGKCCSVRFAEALAAQLGNGYAPDDGGVFTDTANYTSIIPECTNLSVGYFRAHSHHEWQSWPHLEKLLEWLKAVDVADLPVERDPDAYEFDGDDFYSRWDEGLSNYYREGTAGPNKRVDLIRNNPEAVSQFLEEWGVDDGELADIIMSKSGHLKV